MYTPWLCEKQSTAEYSSSLTRTKSSYIVSLSKLNISNALPVKGIEDGEVEDILSIRASVPVENDEAREKIKWMLRNIYSCLQGNGVDKGMNLILSNMVNQDYEYEVIKIKQKEALN